MTEQTAATLCEHSYETRILGGHPISVRLCTLCRTPDWTDLAEQAAVLYRWGREEALAGKPLRTHLSAYDMPRDAAEPAVVSAPVQATTRADVLREAADAIDAETRQLKADAVLEPDKFRPCRDAAEQLRRMAGEEQPATETQRTVRCSAATFKRPHGPHPWTPQPGMEPVRCPGACKCDHAPTEHSPYGCVDDCACEYLPLRQPAVVARQDGATT